MAWLLKLATGGMGGWIVDLVIVVALLAAGAYGGERARGLIDAPKISSAQKDAAEYRAAEAIAEKAVSDLGLRVSEANTAAVTAVAEANAKAAEDSRHQTTIIATLQSWLAQDATTRANLSTQLSEILSHASPGDERPLGPVVLKYLDCLRAHQSGAGAADSAACSAAPN